MDLSITASDWSQPVITQTAQSIFDELFNGVIDKGWFVSNLPTLPTPDLKMGSLDFFLTTNLLMPGQKVISIDSTVGLRVPHDFYIVGNVVTKKQALRRRERFLQEE